MTVSWINDTVWVHTLSWAGHSKWPGHILKRNPKRSMVRFDRLGTVYTRLVPNDAITPRSADRESA